MTSKLLRLNKAVLGIVALPGLLLLSGCASVGDATPEIFLKDLLLNAVAAFLL